MKYLLDANVFIESCKNYYSFDIVPKFWETITAEHKNDKLFSLQSVREEILKQDDELSEWTKPLPKSFFLSETSDVMKKYAEIQQHIRQSNQYTEQAKEEFAQSDNADPYLIAFALTNGYKLVTMEKFNSNKKNKVLIPNICETFKVECINNI
ncbi:MAG: DUF4411 family protein [Endomicrobium sp.]|jgi:hypothetical protein|nr:DUF4411 family protein [Endomicrobium sp.]